MRPVYNKTSTALILITLFGLGIRLLVASRSPLKGDEVGTWLYIQRDFIFLLTHYQHPWLTMGPYIAAMRAWSFVVGSESSFLLRIPSVLAGSLVIPIVAGCAKRLGGTGWVVIVAALLAAFNPYLVEFAATFRSYSVVHAAAPAGLYFLLSWFEKKQARYGWGCALSCGLCVAMHFATAFYCGFLALIFILRWIWKEHRWKLGPALKTSFSLWGPVVVLAVLGLGLLLPFIDKIMEIRSPLTNQAPTALNFLPYMSSAYFSQGWWGLPGLFLLIAGWIYAVRFDPGRAILLGAGMAVPVMLYSWSGTALYPWGATRFLSFILPIILIQISLGIRDLVKHKSLAWLLVLLLLFSWTPSLLGLTHRSDWFAVQEWATSTAGPDDSVMAFGNDRLILSPIFPERRWQVVGVDDYMVHAGNDTIPKGDLLVVLPAKPRSHVRWTKIGRKFCVVYKGENRREIASDLHEDLAHMIRKRPSLVSRSHREANIRLMVHLDHISTHQLEMVR